MLTINFRTTAEEFSDGDRRAAVAAALRQIAEEVESSGYDRAEVRAECGARIGFWKLAEPVRPDA